jgi:SAM-dependent methyltransferase
MRRKAIVILFMGIVLSVFADAWHMSGKKETAWSVQSQELPFQIEEWEKGINQRQPPVKIMDAIGLKPGMVIGEVGAGTGRMTMWLADRVGKIGMVYANDIERSALDHLRRRCRREGFKNVAIIHGKMEDPGFPVNSLDIAFMINVYHHLADPVLLIRNIHQSLKPGGVLAIVECDPDKMKWAEDHGCTGKEGMIEDLKKAGFEVFRIDTFLEEDSIYIARPIAGFVIR